MFQAKLKETFQLVLVKRVSHGSIESDTLKARSQPQKSDLVCKRPCRSTQLSSEDRITSKKDAQSSMITQASCMTLESVIEEISGTLI